MCWPYFGEGEEAANNAVCAFCTGSFFGATRQALWHACTSSSHWKYGLALQHCTFVNYAIAGATEKVEQKGAHNCMHFGA